MAGLRFAVPFQGIQVTTAEKTVVQIKAPANQRLRVAGWRIGASGVVTTDGPIRVRGVRQTDAGTGGTNISANITKLEMSMAESVQSTAQAGPTSAAWTTEPTSGGVQYETKLHPQGANSETLYHTNEIWIKGGEYFGLVLYAPQTNTVDGVVYLEE